MNVEQIIYAAFDREIEKIAAREREKGSRTKKFKTSFRKRKKSLFSVMAKYPVLEAVGSLALTTKGLHHLATGGMFGKRMKSLATGPRAGAIGSLGLGLGTTFLGAKGLANVVERL